MNESLRRLAKFMVVRALSLFVTVVIAVFIAVFIANWGGAMDAHRKNEIRYQLSIQIAANPLYASLPSRETQALVNDLVEQEFERQGLNRPFLVRSISYLGNAITLNLGRAENITSDSGSRTVRLILLERLPPTLLLIGTAQLLSFLIAILVALFLSRRYGSILDKTVIALAPTSAAPAWLYGLFLILLFAAVLRILPWGGMVQAPVPSTTIGYASSVLRHMVLPVTAMILGGIFSSIYSWRTFFLIYSSEDYVELARAKGLSSKELERRYVLRPTLPTIITSFLMMVIYVWTGAIVLETVFNWPGIGRLYLLAVNLNDTPVIVGVVVILGYLLAGTVFLLEFIYAALDPRVRLGSQGGR